MLNLTVVPYIWRQTQPAHKGHNRPDVPAGTEVFAIQHPTSQHFFTYAYLDRGFAEKVAAKLEEPSSIDDATLLHFNFRSSPSCVSARKTFD